MMTSPPKSLDKLIYNLEERVKELNCIYELEEILQRSNLSIDEIFNELILIIPSGWQCSDKCVVRILYRDSDYQPENFKETPWVLSSEIKVEERTVGKIEVYYTEEQPDADIGPFLNEEQQMLNSIALRLGHYIMHQRLKLVFDKWEMTKQDISKKKSGEWEVVLELLQRTDLDFFQRISRKMLNHLIWNEIKEAQELLQQFDPLAGYKGKDVLGESNVPLDKRALGSSTSFSTKVFEIASKHLDNQEILSHIQKWMQQDKTSFLVRTVSSNDTSLNDISDAIRRYYQLTPEGMDLTPSAKMGIRASLTRRFLSDQLEFINIAKHYLRVTAFNNLLQCVIFPTGSHGKLGGKSAGVILAYSILKSSKENEEILKNIKTPKSWFITSDTMIHFMHYNNLDEILEQKYKTVDEIRKEYPLVVQLFKNSHFPADIVQGLSMALDDFGTTPLVVRSSSLLEDRLGTAFAGKYKSLFIANQGGKHERLGALMDAVAEVYASTIGPDPIEYRSERELLDFHEEMGIMIQEVVGTQVGDYYLPAYAGVAFSNNEFRWSPRIKREDGLVRMVPGLGTRAVDRLGDDYPVLIAPGQPGLRANVSIDEMARYSPQKVDLINLKTNKFETIEIKELFKKIGNQYPAVEKVVSIFEDNDIRRPGFNDDFSQEDIIVNFEGLISNTPFVKQAHTILTVLQKALATPVDIEFASDGKDFYLLQCRPQSYSKNIAPSPIPKNIPKDRFIFSADRYVSNGTVPNIKYIVYVRPEKYNELSDHKELLAVGRAVSHLNKLLPKQEFILMGPGRWGSRGDIKLGVSVTYSDINNTAALIEIARKKGNYVPDLSFGTHFFQDLVEASIRYLPLYPDDPGIVFNEEFLSKSPNALFEILPAFSHLSGVIHVIEVSQASGGMVMRLLMNADMDKAVGILAPPASEDLSQQELEEQIESTDEDHLSWKLHLIDKMASQIDPERFGLKALYLLGSTNKISASDGGNIKLLAHFNGTKSQKTGLLTWLEGWSLCLDEMNYMRTGYKSGKLLDIQFASDDEIITKEEIVKEYDLM